MLFAVTTRPSDFPFVAYLVFFSVYISHFLSSHYRVSFFHIFGILAPTLSALPQIPAVFLFPLHGSDRIRS